ncbi:nicotinate phosphoribosyltransferase [Paenibacillus pini]|uniref:Nicotinamide phosphoribosyltransferase n=1 Tax=Paenibacillus pini JCM 16418 TaxID=1236976 RepID=W7Z8L5_9BACL|nr:nicotinate phosphoribosyltransferase [Paenibacillus pini]GAF10784.1 nicotinamide phosphoribosyltransferase [Paenibacillus pini JCM 16418]
MTKTIYPASLLCDFYKLFHKNQYPKNTEQIYSTFTPRSNRYFPQADEVVVFGIQGFVKKYLIEYFNTHFFSRTKEEVVSEYVRYLKYTLGEENPDHSHIEELHDLGYLPIKIKALKEGSKSPIKVPVLTMENTNSKFFWLTNYLETLVSDEIWQPMTSATTAYQYRNLLDEYALKTTGNTDGVGFQGHDFSARGMVGIEGAAVSGAGHLLSFVGTDTVPSIAYLEAYYNADIEKELIGSSIPATEHSVMSASTDADSRDEFEMYKRLITEVYPTGFFSVVSDTYDFWAVIGDILPRLKSEIMSRDGRVVIRPDSGDPVLIITGNPEGDTELERKGLIESLWDIFGGTVTEQGYKVLDTHIGAIYGDSITLERAKQIVERLEAKGFASTNIVLGIGSYTYQYVTRDTLGFAMKATYAVIDGEERMLFKDPKTDDGTKRSQRGRVAVVKVNGELTVVDGLVKHTYNANFADIDQLEEVFVDGKLVRDESLAQIRMRVLNN